jgi:multidrug efflux pump subunit AcrA (membrane-fusion protein)
VIIRIQIIQKEEGAKVVSQIELEKSQGKPVDLLQLTSSKMKPVVRATARLKDPQTLVGYVTRDLQGQLRAGQRITSKLPGREIEGRVTFVSREIDYDYAMYPFRATLNRKVSIDHSKNISLLIHLGNRKSALQVSSQIITKEGDDFVIWSADGERAKRNRVTVGTVSGGFSEILSGLEENQRVVTNGFSRLKEGDRLFVRTCTLCAEKQ